MKSYKAKKEVIEHLRKTPIIEIACSKAGIGRTSFYRWKKTDKRFATAIDEALAEGNYFVNDLAESQLIGAIKERDIRAITLWLRHHHPVYANKLEINGGVQIEHELTSEQKELIEQALKLTATYQAEEIIGELPNTKNKSNEHPQQSGPDPKNN